MKHFLLTLAVVLPLSALAQVRIATVNVQEIFASMPEAKAATEALDKASRQYKAEYEAMQAEFNKKYESYQAIATTDAPAAIKDRRVREIQDGNREIETFLEKSRADLSSEKLRLETPIYNKINAAIGEVGDAGGYTYILDVSTTPVVYSGKDAVDLTQAVKKVLGVN